VFVRGQPAEAKEPGVEIAESIPTELLDAAGTIHLDLACRRCGYNLRGLRPEGRCPECGAAIGLSCYGDLLRFADPKWVETLARGATLVLWGTVVAVLGGLMVVGVALITGNRPLAVFLGLIGGVVALYGAWLITQPDPSGVGEDRYITDRKIVRVTLLLGLAEPAAHLLHAAVRIPFSIEVVLVIVVLLAGLCGAVGEFAKLTYFRKLALRIPNDALAKRAHALRWVVAISLGVLVFSGAIQALFGPGGLIRAPAFAGGRPQGPLLAGVVFGGCIMAVALLVFVIASVLVLVLVNGLRKAFRAQARLARESWAAAEPVS